MGGRPGIPGGGGQGRLGSEEVRQLRGELNQRAGDAEALRRALAELTGQIADDIKMLEYVLRREADGDRPALQLSGSEELPPGYRAMVEEYYRTLARKPKK